MPRFNTLTALRPGTLNRERAPAFEQSDELTLVSLMLTSFLTDQFYRSSAATLAELVRSILRVDPRFAAQAAVFARSVAGMRSVSHVVAAITAARVKGEGWTRRFYELVAVRPDDVTEILACHEAWFGRRPLPNSLKKGLGAALTRFDSYQLAKYRATGRQLSLVDAVNLCHPSSTPALAGLMRGTLPPADTWEVALTRAGQEARSDADKVARKCAAWERLLAENKLGYMALLRNVYAISTCGSPTAVELASRRLVDQQALTGSRILPFRILTALRQLEARMVLSPAVREALIQALDLSCHNVPRFDGTTLVALDVSGSMTWNEGRASESPATIGSLLGAAVFKRNACDLIVFDDEARTCRIDPSLSLWKITSALEGRMTGGGTDFTAIFEHASRRYDRIVILSDMQAWIPDHWGHSDPGPAYHRYCRRTRSHPTVFCIDLQGYGTAQFPEQRVVQLAGFSEKLFDVLPLLEQDRDALVHAVKAVEL